MSKEFTFLEGEVRAHKREGDTLPVRGWASVESVNGNPEIDSYGTVFDADGFDLSRFKDRGRLPMFFNHNYDHPIGRWNSAEVRQENGMKGLWMEGSMFGGTEKQREVQEFVLQGIATDLSIGFERVSTEYVRQGGVEYEKIRAKLVESSVVTLGSNDKSIQAELRKFLDGVSPNKAQVVSFPSLDAAINGIIGHSEGDHDKVRYAIRKLEKALEDATIWSQSSRGSSWDEIEPEHVETFLSELLNT